MQLTEADKTGSVAHLQVPCLRCSSSLLFAAVGSSQNHMFRGEHSSALQPSLLTMGLITMS